MTLVMCCTHSQISNQSHLKYRNNSSLWKFQMSEVKFTNFNGIYATHTLWETIHPVEKLSWLNEQCSLNILAPYLDPVHHQRLCMLRATFWPRPWTNIHICTCIIRNTYANLYQSHVSTHYTQSLLLSITKASRRQHIIPKLNSLFQNPVSCTIKENICFSRSDFCLAFSLVQTCVCLMMSYCLLLPICFLIRYNT